MHDGQEESSRFLLGIPVGKAVGVRRILNHSSENMMGCYGFN
jgi:hypothetical protein